MSYYQQPPPIPPAYGRTATQQSDGQPPTGQYQYPGDTSQHGYGSYSSPQQNPQYASQQPSQYAQQPSQYGYPASPVSSMHQQQYPPHQASQPAYPTSYAPPTQYTQYASQQGSQQAQQQSVQYGYPASTVPTMNHAQQAPQQSSQYGYPTSPAVPTHPPAQASQQAYPLLPAPAIHEPQQVSHQHPQQSYPSSPIHPTYPQHQSSPQGSQPGNPNSPPPQTHQSQVGYSTSQPTVNEQQYAQQQPPQQAYPSSPVHSTYPLQQALPQTSQPGYPTSPASAPVIRRRPAPSIYFPPPPGQEASSVPPPPGHESSNMQAYNYQSSYTAPPRPAPITNTYQPVYPHVAPPEPPRPTAYEGPPTSHYSVTPSHGPEQYASPHSPQMSPAPPQTYYHSVAQLSPYSPTPVAAVYAPQYQVPYAAPIAPAASPLPVAPPSLSLLSQHQHQPFKPADQAYVSTEGVLGAPKNIVPPTVDTVQSGGDQQGSTAPAPIGTHQSHITNIGDKINSHSSNQAALVSQESSYIMIPPQSSNSGQPPPGPSNAHPLDQSEAPQERNDASKTDMRAVHDASSPTNNHYQTTQVVLVTPQSSDLVTTAPGSHPKPPESDVLSSSKAEISQQPQTQEQPFSREEPITVTGPTTSDDAQHAYCPPPPPLVPQPLVVAASLSTDIAEPPRATVSSSARLHPPHLEQAKHLFETEAPATIQKITTPERDDCYTETPSLPPPLPKKIPLDEQPPEVLVPGFSESALRQPIHVQQHSQTQQHVSEQQHSVAQAIATAPDTSYPSGLASQTQESFDQKKSDVSSVAPTSDPSHQLAPVHQSPAQHLVDQRQHDAPPVILTSDPAPYAPVPAQEYAQTPVSSELRPALQQTPPEPASNGASDYKPILAHDAENRAVNSLRPSEPLQQYYAPHAGIPSDPGSMPLAPSQEYPETQYSSGAEPPFQQTQCISATDEVSNYPAPTHSMENRVVGVPPPTSHSHAPLAAPPVQTNDSNVRAEGYAISSLDTIALNVPAPNSHDILAGLSAQMNDLDMGRAGYDDRRLDVSKVVNNDGPRAPKLVQDMGEISDVVNWCPETRIVEYALDWYRLPQVPDYLICTKCHAENIKGKPLADKFERVHRAEGTASTCGFWFNRVKDILWPQASESGNLDAMCNFMRKSPKMLVCKGRTIVTGEEGFKWFGMTNNDIDGFIACEACYENRLVGTKFESRFAPFREQGKDDRWSCDLSHAYIAWAAPKMSKDDDWQGFVAAALHRIKLPVCEGIVLRANAYSWYLPRREIKDLHVCEACYLDRLAPTRFAGEFEPYVKATGIDAFIDNFAMMFTCKLNVKTLSLLFALETALDRRDYQVFHTAAEAICQLVPCTQHGIIRGNWWTVAGGCENYDVCEACYKGIFVPSGLERFFEPAQRNPEATLICDFCPASPRYTQYFNKYLEAVDLGVFSHFTGFIKKFAGVARCPGIKHRDKTRWWGYPEALFCQDCYISFVVDTPLGNAVPVKDEYDERAMICQIWSPRMRKMWMACCAAGAPGSTESEAALAEFRAFGTKRLQVYNATVPQIDFIRQMKNLRMQSAMNRGMLSVMYSGMNSFAAVSGTTDGNLHGNSSLGWYETENGATGAQMLNNMQTGMANANRADEWMQMAQLQSLWNEVE